MADSRADVGYVLLLLQAGFEVLATLGMVVVMGGNVAYAIVPGLHAVALLLFASFVARGHRWAWWTVAAVEGLTLAGFQLNLVVGLLPQVQVTLTLVGLLTTVALPLAVLWQTANLAARS